jgi:hypothetical protein
MKGWSKWRAGETAGDIFRTALLGCVVGALLASSVAVVSAARTLELGPKVGDILVFRPGLQISADWDFSAVTTGDQLPVSCTLKPVVMGSGGGSLVVEERLDHPRAFRVHWAGGRTTAGGGDCGATADLIVSGPDLQLLTNAVGGAGVERRAFGNF